MCMYLWRPTCVGHHISHRSQTKLAERNVKSNDEPDATATWLHLRTPVLAPQARSPYIDAGRTRYLTSFSTNSAMPSTSRIQAQLLYLVLVCKTLTPSMSCLICWMSLVRS